MRYLTKSRFKLGLECLTKLFYTRKPKYPDMKQEDTFLQALAEGGIQVGELARWYYSGGIIIEEIKETQIAIDKTEALLKKTNVILYEPAFAPGNLLCRCDIIVKKGNKIKLIEVKSKSYNSVEGEDFSVPGWEPYMWDIAFQAFVIMLAHPEYEVSSYIMLCDKSKQASIDGLNQLFQLAPDGKFTTPGDLSLADLGEKIMGEECVDEIVRDIHATEIENEHGTFTFETYVDFLAKHYENDKKIVTQIGPHCGGCEFDIELVDETKEKKSGFRECWKKQLGWKDDEFKHPSIFDLWDNRRKKQQFKDGLLQMRQLSPSDLGIKDDLDPGDGPMTRNQRQWIQVDKVTKIDSKHIVLRKGLKDALESLEYPYQFIDFETSMVAIPFHKGRRPYEQVAFQYSHHTLEADGTITHANEFISDKKGVFPNYEFLLSLKKSLEKTTGTIFMFSSYENTVLNQVLAQLLLDDEVVVPEKDKMIEWLLTIVRLNEGNSEKLGTHTPVRGMYDMRDLVKGYFFHPMTCGSNSIKKVLPAMLDACPGLIKKYSKPIYGAKGGISSKNFKDWAWFTKEGSDPYKLLPPVFSEADMKELALIYGEENLADGGAAMTAYAKMQFMQISDAEHKKLKEGLLRYCELDTMAMVMIMEGFWELSL